MNDLSLPKDAGKHDAPKKAETEISGSPIQLNDSNTINKPLNLP